MISSRTKDKIRIFFFMADHFVQVKIIA